MASNVAAREFHNVNSRRQTVLLWQVSMWVLACAGIFLLIAGIVLGSERLVASSAAVLPSLILASYQHLAREREIFSPMNFVFLSVFLGVTLQTVYLCFIDDGGHRFALGWKIDTNSLLTSIAAISIGMMGLVVGYSLVGNTRVFKRVRKIDTQDWRRGRIRISIFVMFFVSLLSLLYFAAAFNIWENFTSQFSVKRRIYSEETGVSASLQYVRFGALFSQMAFFILLARHIWMKRNGQLQNNPVLMYACGVLGAFLPFIASSRLGLISFLLGACLIHHFGTGGWRIKQLRRAFLIAACVIVVMGSLRFMQSRGLNFQDYRSNTTVASLLAPIMGSSNFLAVGKTAMLIEKVPNSYAHTYGSTYGLWLIAPIPRAFWPEKPIVRIGGVLGAAIFGSDQRSGIPPGSVGEAYLNFGWIGIPIMMGFLGCMLKLFYNTFGRYAYSNINHAIIYSSAIVFVAFSGISADFTAVMSNGLQRIVPLLFILNFITRKQNSVKR